MKKLKWKIAQAAEIWWWNNYLKNKPKDTYLQQKKAYWHRFLNHAQLTISAKEKILDAGCGPAGIFSILPNNEVDALDPLLDQYEYQLPHFSKVDYPNVRFICVPLESFETENQYDFIFCLNAINHVRDIELALDKLISTLKPGGKLALSIDVHKSQIFKALFRLIPADALHPHQYNLKEYTAMLEKRRLTVTKTVILKTGWIFDYSLLIAHKAIRSNP